MTDESKLQQRMQKIGDLIHRLDPAEAARTRELLESVMDLHGEALDRMLQRLRASGDAGESVIGDYAADPVVSSVLLLHGLHPLDFETRVAQAIERAHATLHAYGVFAEVTLAREGNVRIRFRGVDSAFTARAAKAAVEDQMYASAPDAANVTFLGLEKFAERDFVPVEALSPVEKA